MIKKEILANYLSNSFHIVLEDDIISEGGDYYKCDGISYMVLTESEAEDYFISITNELDDEAKYLMRQAKLDYLIDYIHFDEVHEYENIIDYGFNEYTFEKETYYISEA